MSNTPDNTEKGSIAPQGSMAQMLKKKSGKLLWAWIAGGAALLAALALILVLAVLPSGPAADGENVTNLPPLLYKEDDNIYLVAGAESIKLDSAPSEGSYYFRGEVSGDGDTLYYLINFNASSYESDLMRIKLGDKNARPERVAEHVLYARISPDERKILFMTGGAFGPYNLYICPPGEEPVVIARSVSDFDFGFSADGSYVYYYTYDNDNGCLYMNLHSGNEAKVIFDNNYEKDDRKNVSQSFIDESGNALIVTGYFGMVEKQDYTAYLYENGETRCVVEHASFVRSLGRADEFLYATPDNELVFYDRGDEQVISDKGSGLDFVNDMWRKAADKRFVFTEGGEDPNTAVLYEFTEQDGKTRIGNTGWNYYPNADFSRVAYGNEDGLYAACKAGGKWIETKICEKGGLPAFDAGGNYIYYCKSSGNTRKDRTLYRMSMGTGKEEKLFDGVIRYLLWKGECYALSFENDVYRIKNGNDSELLQEGISDEELYGNLCAAKDGVYAYKQERTFSFSNLYYISGGKAKLVTGGGEDVEFVECAGLMPLRLYD